MPETIAGEQQPLLAPVPRGECEHSDQPAEAGAALLRQQMHQHFGITGRMPGSRQRRAQLLMIVNLAVVGQYLRLELHGLVTALRQIQNCQSAVSQGDSRFAPSAFAVGTAMPEAPRHAAGDLDAGL